MIDQILSRVELGEKLLPERGAVQRAPKNLMPLPAGLPLQGLQGLAKGGFRMG